MSDPHPYVKTQTPGIYYRASRYVVKWTEDAQLKRRSFKTYEEACAFRRDFVEPYRRREALPPNTVAPKPSLTGWVYFMQSRGEDRAVKIGWSRDVARRLADLRTMHPYGMDLVALIPGGKDLEKAFHVRFASRRLGREWFSREVVTDLTAIVAADVGSFLVPSGRVA
jgi:hypothetical protein